MDIGDILLTMYEMIHEAALKKVFEEYNNEKSDT